MSVSPKEKKGGREQGRKTKMKLEEGMKRSKVGRKVTKKEEKREGKMGERRLLLEGGRTKREEK